MPRVYGQVMIGYGPPLVAGGTFFVVGPESQIASMERYIAAVAAPRRIARLSPRDFWLVAETKTD